MPLDQLPGLTDRALLVSGHHEGKLMTDTILLGTRKGTVMIDRQGSGWRPRPILHAGVPVCYAARDPRDGTLWASLDHGHWGPKLSRSRDGGKTWEDISSLKPLAGRTSPVDSTPAPSPEGCLSVMTAGVPGS